MPKIYEYLGIYLLFYSNDHEPIHIHAKTKEGREMKVNFYIKNSKITKIVYKPINGRKPLTLPQMKKLKALVNSEKYQIVNAWTKFFIYKDRIKVKKITSKIK